MINLSNVDNFNNHGDSSKQASQQATKQASNQVSK